jgi:hypothetical protein
MCVGCPQPNQVFTEKTSRQMVKLNSIYVGVSRQTVNAIETGKSGLVK